MLYKLSAALSLKMREFVDHPQDKGKSAAHFSWFSSCHRGRCGQPEVPELCSTMVGNGPCFPH